MAFPATQSQLSLPSLGVGKWVPALAGKEKAGMVYSVSRCTRGVQVKLWDPLRTRAIPESLRGVIMTRRYTNPRLPYLTLPPWYFQNVLAHISCIIFHTAFHQIPKREKSYLKSKQHKGFENLHLAFTFRYILLFLNALRGWQRLTRHTPKSFYDSLSHVMRLQYDK